MAPLPRPWYEPGQRTRFETRPEAGVSLPVGAGWCLQVRSTESDGHWNPGDPPPVDPVKPPSARSHLLGDSSPPKHESSPHHLGKPPFPPAPRAHGCRYGREEGWLAPAPACRRPPTHHPHKPCPPESRSHSGIGFHFGECLLLDEHGTPLPHSMSPASARGMEVSWS